MDGGGGDDWGRKYVCGWGGSGGQGSAGQGRRGQGRGGETNSKSRGPSHHEFILNYYRLAGLWKNCSAFYCPPGFRCYPDFADETNSHTKSRWYEKNSMKRLAYNCYNFCLKNKQFFRGFFSFVSPLFWENQFLTSAHKGTSWPKQDSSHLL